MASPSPVQQQKKATRKPAPAKNDELQATRKPAYLKRKMPVSQPGDPEEREADQVAQQVSRAVKNEAVEKDEANQPAPEETPPVAQRLSRKIARSEASEESQEQEQAQEQQKEEQETAASNDTEPAQPSVDERIEQTRGVGNPLPANLLQDMEKQFSTSLAHVIIHQDATAAELCHQLNARAFTVGSDIYFAPGEYAPDTDAGRELLAHELTHVVQNTKVIGRKIFRSNGSAANATTGIAPTPPAGITPIEPTPQDGPYEFDKNGKRYKYVAVGSPKELHLPQVRVPNFKQRHQSLHPTPLERAPGERNTNQRQAWRNHFNTSLVQPVENAIDSARRRGGTAEGDVYFFKGTRNQQLMLFGTRDQLLDTAIFPFWDRQQQTRTFQVDHRREDQLGGHDELTNYELLDASANGSSGSMIAREINSEIGGAISVLQSPFYRSKIGAGARRISGDPGYIKNHYKLQFNSIRYNLGDIPNGDRYWSVDQITQGDHLRQFRPLTERELQMFSNPRRPMLYTSPQGGIGIQAPDSAGQRVQIWPRVVATGPLNIVDENTATLTVDAYRASDNPQSLHASYPNLTFSFTPVPRAEGSATYKSWAIDKDTSRNNALAAGSGGVFQSLRLPGLSPIQMDFIDIDPALGFVGRGKLLPTVPLLAQADIDVLLQGSEIRLQKTFSLSELQLPSPFQITRSSITAFMGTQGLGIEGEMGIEVANLGTGEISARISSNRNFEAEGKFSFDPNLFDRAEIDLWYRNNQFGGSGTLAINTPNKIKGIRSASVSASYTEGNFSATGEVQPDIPGIQQAGLTVAYSETDGLTIGGNLQLTSNPALHSGAIDVTVNKRDDDWKVRASGTAQPAIPGVDSQLTVSYDDGAFTAEFSGAFQRGRLAGRATVGATNRSIDEEGQPSGDPLPGNNLNVYGSGTATIRLTPWLQGTAGIRFAPNGEVTVSGEISIPNDVEIFARREISKTLLNVSTDIPIIPGIIAEIGGSLSASAGIGPGMLDELNLGITYNPSREQDTHITGRAHLRVPADAGLRLAVRAGIGLGIPGVSVTGGLEIGGKLGIEGAAEAGVSVDWTPATGLDLRAELYVHAQPAFTFDISGYVRAKALLWEVYSNRWTFASMQFGSDYRFGIRVPVHYIEGQPFNLSLDDVRFEIPEISPRNILSGLIDRIA